MKSVIAQVSSEETNKYSTDLPGYKRVAREQEVFEFLKGCPYIPTVIETKNDNQKASIRMQTLQGQSLRKILGMLDEYDTVPIEWRAAKKLLMQYINAEMDLLARGALYRDMNLDHILFTSKRAFLLDVESTITSAVPGKWRFCDMRGTWETMAPEEFAGYGELSARTATYRVAVIAYILLVGKLPFKHFPHSRSDTHHWRMRHPVVIVDTLNEDTRRVFKIGLARKPTHRYKDPAVFLMQLKKSYEAH